jgi:Tol biopolymer transport system component
LLAAFPFVRDPAIVIRRVFERRREHTMYRLIMLAFAGAALTALMPISGGAKGTAPSRNGRIAFTRSDPAVNDDAVYTVNPNGKRVRVVWARAEGGTWAPDGKRLAFFVHPNGPERIINVDTRKYVDLPTHYPGDLFLPCAVWSPDGKRLACEGFGPENDPSQNGIYTVRSSDGVGVERLTMAPGGDDLPGDYSPDGTRLVFFRAGDEPALYVIGTDGAGLRRITPSGFEPSFFGGSWSPGGNRILLSGKTSPSAKNAIYVVRADGQGLKKLRMPGCGTSIGCVNPQWSPNGKKFAFDVFFPATSQSDIYVARANGTGRVRVTKTAQSEGQPDWGTHPVIQ